MIFPPALFVLNYRRLAPALPAWARPHWGEAALLLISFVQLDPSGGSIFPATWSAMLAARAEGIGASLTTIMNVLQSDRMLEILGAPDAQGRREFSIEGSM